MLQEKPVYPPSVTQKVNEAYTVINKPYAAFKLMARGDLTSNHVAALKAVHPTAYQNMTSELITQISDKPSRKLSIVQKQQLSTFLQQPVNPSYGNDFAQWAQANAVGAPPSQPTPKTSGKQLSIGEQSFTNFEKQQSNKES